MINNDSIFIGRSIGPIFIIKYLMKNNLKINKLFSVSGFNNCSIDNGGEYDQVNSSMFIDNLIDFKNYCNYTTCFISKNDPYVKYNDLQNFTNTIANKTICIDNGGHFNSDSGYGNNFTQLLTEIVK